jgi:hypothetical protein
MRPRGGTRRSARAGRIPAWLPLGIVLVGILSLVARLEREAEARGVARIDATCYRLHRGDRWISQAWTAQLEQLLVEARSLAAGDRGAIDELVGRIEALSFVAEVGEPEVEWPDGLVLPVRLHQPVACLRVGDDFLPVAADGTVLAGYCYQPHPAFGGHLPVLGPHGLDADPDFPFGPGDVLGHPAHRAALAVAESMQDYLGAEDLGRLGRVVVDASRSHAWNGMPGGVVIDLEGERRIHFGRSPHVAEPGELSVETKFVHFRDALARWEKGDRFRAIDVRWDEADLLGEDP